jgi:antitoxin ParD1/3/4
MNVHLTPELEQLVQKKVRTGRYNSASEVVREALRLLEEYDGVRTTQLRESRKRIDAGLSSLDRVRAWMASYLWEGSFLVLVPRLAAAKRSDSLRSFTDRPG